MEIKGKHYVIAGIILFVIMVTILIISCSNSSNSSNSSNEVITNGVKEYGVAYRYVNVLSGGKSVWEFKGTVDVKVDGDTVIIKANSGKEHIFVNADVVIRQIDKNNKDSSEGKISKDSKNYKNSKESKSTTENSIVESSVFYDIDSSTIETSSISTVSDVSSVSSISNVSNVSSVSNVNNVSR